MKRELNQNHSLLQSSPTDLVKNLLMNSSKLRKEFLEFFEKKGHKIVPSSSLIPTDPSVLFTTAGMQQFKPYFIGEKSPYGSRATSVQKCVRTSDIDEVGDESHLTFFEMLGNFSFGDYFKKETIEMAIEFLTKKCKLPENKLWFTYFSGQKDLPEDIDSKNFLLENNIAPEKIFPFNKETNWWGPTGNEGPCGPTVEIHFDLTGKPCDLKDKCLPNCKCGRFIEIWNLVFNEYYQNQVGELSLLKQKGVDTGMGFERLAAVCQKKETVFETDLFEPLIKIMGRNNDSAKQRIIADHIRSSVFLIAEGIMPLNVERGYILRRLLRKIFTNIEILGLEQERIYDLVKAVVKNYKEIYPELEQNKENIMTVIQQEADKFDKAKESGRKIYDKIESMTGAFAFELYSSHSIPLEITQEWAKRDGKEIENIDHFYKLQKEHKEISRAGAEKKFGGVGKEASLEAIKLHTATHLLHTSLRKILGNEIKQMGSDITPERLRFDFSFDRKLSEQEIKQIEDLVNKQILEDIAVVKQELSLKQALDSGATAFFKEKYPDNVTVYSIGEFSKEICAGPHIEKTGKLGSFKIIKQESVGSGIRRIKAILN